MCSRRGPSREPNDGYEREARLTAGGKPVDDEADAVEDAGDAYRSTTFATLVTARVRASDYFFKPKNPNLLDEETLAGHPLGLLALSKLMSKRVETTGATGELLRHGILHGRELAYDTLVNSTKAWAALFAVIDGVKKRAEVLNKAAAEARERRYAGSKELDEYGRRLDRRGFDAAKKLLFDISAYQFGSHKRQGRYAAGRKELDPSGRLLDGKTFELRTSDDGQEYWAWVQTPTGLVFGIAGRGGDHPVWQYQGEEPPAGGIDSEADWRHVATDEALPDW